MTKKIYIFGASGHGKVVADIAKNQGYEVAAFIDDDNSKNEFCGFGCVRLKDIPQNSLVALAIGSNSARAKVAQKILDAKHNLATLIHSSAVISQSSSIDIGSVVMPLAIINADAKIGKGAIINSGAIVEHDCTLGDFVHICPKAALAGNVNVRALSWIGISSCVIQGKNIGKSVIVGAGAVVINDIEDGLTIVGVPAKKFV
ncbi:MAG: hypothetical protein RL154_1718 [Pseudomonadota bacterium]|jgi:UDP-N-acetylbacillosamine N-acetyltransferase